MTALGGFLVVLCAWLLGRALLPSRAQLERSAYEEQGSALLLGLGALPLAAFLLGWIGVPLSAPLAWILAAAGAAFGVLRVRRDRGSGTALAPSGFGFPAAALLAALAAGSIALTLAWPLNEFDPILHFAQKGRVLYGGGAPGGEAFTALRESYGRIMTHPNYPLAVPYLEAFAAHLGGAWSDRWIQVPLAFWSAALPAAVGLGLRAVSPRAAAWGALLAASVPMLYGRAFLAGGLGDFASAGLGEDKMLGGRADLPIAAWYALGCALLLRARAAQRLAPALLAGVAFAAAGFAKNEGAALLGVAALALVLEAAWPARRRLWPAAVALGVAALLLAPWLLHRSGLPAIDENYGSQLGWERLAAAFSGPESTEAAPIRPELYGADWTEHSQVRAWRVARYFGQEFVQPLSWGLLWLLAALALFVRRPRAADDGTRWLGSVVLGGIALYVLVLLVTPWFLPALHRKGIPDRLLLHLVGPAALLVGARLFGSATEPADR